VKENKKMMNDYSMLVKYALYCIGMHIILFLEVFENAQEFAVQRENVNGLS
jgi:hypothetical protein